MTTPPPFSPPPPRSRRSPTGLIIGLVVGGVLLVVLVCGVLGVGGWLLLREEPVPTLAESLEVDDPTQLNREHRSGPIDYAFRPPMGGPHNAVWQNCEGTVYDAPIADEHAMHSLEHGAVWFTYAPALNARVLGELATLVRAQDHQLLSPYPGQASPISVQAWGYRVAVDSPDDPRVAEFVGQFRLRGPEPGATCSGGRTTTGTTPE